MEVKTKKNILYIFLGLLILGGLIWVAYDIPEKQRLREIIDYENCVKTRTDKLYSILAGCGESYLKGGSCPTYLTDKTIETIEKVKDECRMKYLRI